MKLGLIYARARNGVIGSGGGLPWHLPEDLAHFKRITMGHPVIMGRKTWESLPERFRPLPGRLNIVVTRQSQWRAAGASRAGSLEQALSLCEGEHEAWIIGGADIFGQALPFAQIAEITEIDADFEGEVYAPELGAQWQETARQQHVSATGLPFSFATYHNTQAGD